ncbi:unnamed protein product [Prorocentrum cordatum]|uniref:Histone deacetylase domain-containing protein n=1 Tax=Prorocentrum cordatum TaxID=2364126 RepID=A0ABN9W7V4_9DINO|nr:unnamed protein product [Polarella glacialis]
MRRLEAEGLSQRCQRLPCREATREELELRHTAEHVEAMLGLGALGEAAAAQKGREYKDVFLCPESTTAALLSAGAVLEATERVCAGEAPSPGTSGRGGFALRSAAICT